MIDQKLDHARIRDALFKLGGIAMKIDVLAADPTLPLGPNTFPGGGDGWNRGFIQELAHARDNWPHWQGLDSSIVADVRRLCRDARQYFHYRQGDSIVMFLTDPFVYAAALAAWKKSK
jgi:hypothetical protein